MGYFVGLVLGGWLGVLSAFNNLQPSSIDELSNSCKNNAGIEKATVDFAGIVVKCKDGAKFTLKD